MRARALMIVASLGLVVAGCGGSSSKLTLKVASNADLKRSIVVDADGRSLYMFAQDTGGKATCVGNAPAPSCGKIWPPLVAQGKLQVGKGIDQKLLGTTKRSDGKTQVTYNKHPLYYFAGYGGTRGDRKAGDIRGQAFFGVWFVVSPKGAQITQQ